MHHYLSHLITDMRQAAKNLPAKPYYDIPPEAEGIEYVIEWENAVAKPMQEWFGIAKENFPPAEKLTNDQLLMMVSEILKLWDAYNFYADMPENLPAKIAYTVLVAYFDKPVSWVSEGTCHIMLCDGDPDNCPYPKDFCYCEKNIEEDEQNTGMLSENASEIAILNTEISEIEAMDVKDFSPKTDMVRYVDQLISDMSDVVEKMKQPEIIPNTNEWMGAEDTRQLIENPFVTIAELSGIEEGVFPEHTDMDGLQTRKVLRAMLQVLDAFYLKVYWHEQAPHEFKYEALREEWGTYMVKHLPLSGDDIDLCTGDSQTCPFGEYCDCDQPMEFDLLDVPAKYRQAVKNIAQNNDCGLICFFNPDSGELEDAMPEWLESPEEFEDITGEKWEDTYKFETWKHAVIINPPESHESFTIMEDFSEYKVTGPLQQQLLEALYKKKPFRNFNHLIHQSDYKQEWFDYKQNRLEERAWEILRAELPEAEKKPPTIPFNDDEDLPF